MLHLCVFNIRIEAAAISFDKTTVFILNICLNYRYYNVSYSDQR